MSFPTPSGAAPGSVAFTTVPYANQLAQIENAMRAQGWNQTQITAFDRFQATYHSLNPSASAQQALDAYVAEGLGTSLNTGLGGTASALGQLPGAAAAGANTAANNPLLKAGASATNAAEGVVGAVTSVPEFLSRLTSGNTWLRVGEFILGALLIMAGALHLSGQSGDIGGIAKTAVKFIK